MSDGADLRIDASKLDRDADRLVRRYLAAGTETVAGATRGLEKKLEAATQAAVPGRLWRAWQSSAYPTRGPAQNPAGTIWLKGGARTRGAVQFWTEPGAVRGKQGQYLAIPTPAAGSRGRMRRGEKGSWTDLTPEEWERASGVKLRFVYRAGRASLLVADDAVLSGRRQLARRNTKRRIAAGRGSATVIVFVLLPMVRHRNAFAIDPLVRDSEGEMAKLFLAAVAAAQADR